MSHSTESGDPAGPCPACGSGETHVSYEDISANYCRSCRSYFRATPPEGGHA